VLARVEEHIPIDASFLEALFFALTDEDWYAQHAARLCLERLKAQVPQGLMPRLFTHENAKIRRTALTVFGKAAQIEHLILAAQDGDTRVRLAAIQALRYHGDEIPRIVLLHALRDQVSQIRAAAGDMLEQLARYGRIRNPEPSMGVLPIQTPRSKYPEWKLVAKLCKQWRNTTPDIVEAAVPLEYLETWDPHILPIGNLNRTGVQTILVPTSDEHGSVDPLTKALMDLSKKIASEGLQVLKQCVPADRLLATLDDENGEARRIAIQALEERVPEDRLILALDDEDCQVRRAAIKLLRQRMPTEELMAALNDEYGIVREAALQVVRTLEAGLPEALLVEALEHPNGSMRASAIRALGQRAPAEKLLPALGDSDEKVRLATAEVLRLAHPETWQLATSEVMTVLTSPGTSTILDSAAQCFLADLIGGLEQASLVLLETLSRLLTWPYWEVQVRAAQALGRLRRSIPESALRRLYRMRSDSASKTVRRAAEDALAEILSLEAGIEDEGYESVESPMSAVE
jgi:HEAT repeat protein